MPRPILFDVDEKSVPPRMTICFVERPLRFVSVNIRNPGATHETASRAAVAELNAIIENPLHVQLLAEHARPMPVVPDFGPAVEAIITPVEQEERYAGVIHCPACCHPLGRGDSPAIGYLKSCSACKRGLIVTFTPGAVTVTLWTP